MNRPRIAINGGRLIDPANGVDGDLSLYIADGEVVAVGARPDGFEADQEIHVPGQVVCPGFIDLSVRVREPGYENKATVASEVEAACRAGVTTLCCPPDTNPVIDTPAVAELLKELADLTGKARILPIGALTQGLIGCDLSEMRALKEAGCVAVSNGLGPLANGLVLRRALEYAASFDLLVMLRPEDPWLRDGGVVHEGVFSARLGLPGIPEVAETVAVAQFLALVEQVGGRAHLCQLSCARSMRMISRAQYDRVPVSADVAVHHLHLTEEALADFDPMYYVIPPFRTEADREGLIDGVRRGVISALCSDHQPHEEGGKLDVFAATDPGIASLETLLPLTLALVDEGALSLSQAIARLTEGPARLLDRALGRLDVGRVADVCIFDPTQTWTVDCDHWLSRGRNTPFWGRTLKGRVTRTIYGGRLVYSVESGGT